MFEGGLVSPTEASGDGGASEVMERMPVCSGKCRGTLLQYPFTTGFPATHLRLDEACLTGDRLRLDRLPATTRLRFLTRIPHGLLLAH